MFVGIVSFALLGFLNDTVLESTSFNKLLYFALLMIYLNLEMKFVCFFLNVFSKLLDPDGCFQ